MLWNNFFYEYVKILNDKNTIVHLVVVQILFLKIETLARGFKQSLK